MKKLSTRQRLHEQRDPGEKLDQTPIELPLGARTERGLSIGQQIQEQIAIQLAKKNQGSTA